MAQIVSYICGFETGDGSELNTLGGSGTSIQSATVATGGYAIKVGNAASTTIVGLAATMAVWRCRFQTPAIPGVNTAMFRPQNTSASNYMQVRITTTGTLEVVDGATSIGLSTTAGTAVLAINTWYLIELAIDLTASGVVKVWVNGVLDINTTHSSNPGTTIDRFAFVGVANPNQFFFDDIRIDTGGVAAIGAGRIIVRQGIAGTPTYDAWTKNGAATAALCWSDTPFSAVTNCSDNVLSDAQTMLVALFSATQSGHGIETIGPGDVINGSKVMMIAKTAVAGNIDIRRRVGGVDTNVTKALTTSDAYYDTGIITTLTFANLTDGTTEIGVANDLVGTTETVEDMWLGIDYTDVGIRGAASHGANPQRRRWGVTSY
jgi:hypothetical protein